MTYARATAGVQNQRLRGFSEAAFFSLAAPIPCDCSAVSAGGAGG
jgi:hypothetical protein